MKWLALGVLWAAAACGESVIVASELVSDASATPSDCRGESTRAQPAPAVFELVVDTSGSMDDDLPDQRGTKWTVTRDALLEAIAAMPEQTSLGVVFYPDVEGQSAPVCFNRDADITIDVLGPAGSEQRRRIADAFDEQSPEGGAPTHDAYDYAFDQLRSSEAEGRRFMLLIADNYPTYEIGCRGGNPIDADPLIDASGFAQASGVSTFVIGLPGGELARPTLSRMAAAGGTAPGCSSHMGPNYCHFDLSDEQDFANRIERALGDIMTTALSCSYSAPAPASSPSNPDQLQVSFNPGSGPAETLQQSPAGPCDEGWQYSADGTAIVLCKRTCERLRQANGNVEFRSECPAQSP